MKKFIKGYNPKTAPAINVPKLGHTSRIEENDIGIVSRSLKGFQALTFLLVAIYIFVLYGAVLLPMYTLFESF